MRLDSVHPRHRPKHVCRPHNLPPQISCLPQSFSSPFRLKWKPPSENSIDFKLVLKFPPSPTNPSQPDLLAKPLFALYAWLGGEGSRAEYEPYDVMHVTDDEWEQYVNFRGFNTSSCTLQTYTLSTPGFCRMKLSGEQFEDRIVEVHWDPVVEGWRMMRFRSDKPSGNHISTVESIINSIRDGVEKDMVRTPHENPVE